MSSPSVSKKDEFVAETFDEISQSIPYKTGSFVLASWKYYQSLSFYMKVLVWVAAINMIIITMIVVKKLFDLDQETFTHIVVSGLLGFIFAMTYMISFLCCMSSPESENDNDFDPAFFVYLNPELVAFRGLTVENARSTYLDPEVPSLYVRQSVIPRSFNEHVFLENHRRACDISDLNRLILLTDDQESGGEFLRNINQKVALVSTNRFSLRADCPSEFRFSPKVMSVGDRIQIVKNNAIRLEATVAAIDEGQESFTACNAKFDFEDRGACYFLHGIMVADLRRIAYINYVVLLLGSRCRATVYDKEFNPELYKLLYPETRAFTREKAFLHYTSCRESGDMRIGAVQDLRLSPARQEVLDGDTDPDEDEEKDCQSAAGLSDNNSQGDGESVAAASEDVNLLQDLLRRVKILEERETTT